MSFQCPAVKNDRSHTFRLLLGHRCPSLRQSLGGIKLGTRCPTTDGSIGSHACGVGAGIHDEYSAMPMGCAADLPNFELPDALPSFIKNVSVNAGTSFLTHDGPDYTFKMGMSFSFGTSYSKANASNFEADFGKKLALVHQKTQRTPNKQTEALKNVQKDNREMQRVNLKAFAENKAIKNINLLLLAKNEALQEQIDNLKTDKDELIALRVANE